MEGELAVSYEPEQRVGELLDQALGEELGLYFQPAWHPQHQTGRKRSRAWRTGLLSAAAAAAVLIALPFTIHLPVQRGSVGNSSLSAVHLPTALSSSIADVSQSHFQVESMVPVYGTYPMARPTGHDLTISGSFHIGSISGDSLSLLVNNRMQLQGGMLFKNGTPVYNFSGSTIQSGAVIAASSKAQPAKGTWWSNNGTNVAITSFSAPGQHVYVTHGNLWADQIGGTQNYWRQSPGDPNATVQDSIAGLPSHPSNALLLEENPSGLSRGFITRNGGTTWHGWSLGTQSISDLIAIGNRYWAILNGTLAWSLDGNQWNNVLPLNTHRWQVETYAIDPANPNTFTVSLIPISGDGVGPVLQTHNGGRTWSEVPNFPATGAAPTTMVMTAEGGISALVNSNGPVVVQYSPKTQQWSVFPVPAQKDNLGLGQLAASANGNLLYGAPGGDIYQWIKQSQKWLLITAPQKVDPSGVAPSPLQAIGNNQVLAGYPTSWQIFWEPPGEAQGTAHTKTTPLKSGAALRHP